MTKIELNKYSINKRKKKIATYVLKIPRIILPEITRHRMFSFSVASSRAIPTKTLLKKLKDGDAFVPETWRKNERGMSPSQYISPSDALKADKLWAFGLELMISLVEEFDKLGISKEQTNRLLEPFLYVDMVLTGTEFDNFFDLRCDKAAQEELRNIAMDMKRLYIETEPEVLDDNEYHIPMLYEDEKDMDLKRKIRSSVARCARASYANFFGNRDYNSDNDLYEKLVSSKHFSPLEHVAVAAIDDVRSGNLIGWEQWRHIYDRV